VTRLRLRYTKLGKIRFLGHRDLARVWERALRRSGLSVASTEGFSPRPKVHFGLALSTGFESLGEYIDVDLDPTGPQVDVDGLPGVLTPLLPGGVDVHAAAEIDRGTSLQAAVGVCTWRVEVGGVGPEQLGERVASLLAADTVAMQRTRKERTVELDVRPSIALLQVHGPALRDTWPTGTVVGVELRTEAPGLKMAELLGFLAPEAIESRVCRTHQWIEQDGARHEPLPSATPAAHAQVRAS